MVDLQIDANRPRRVTRSWVTWVGAIYQYVTTITGREPEHIWVCYVLFTVNLTWIALSHFFRDIGGTTEQFYLQLSATSSEAIISAHAGLHGQARICVSRRYRVRRLEYWANFKKVHQTIVEMHKYSIWRCLNATVFDSASTNVSKYNRTSSKQYFHQVYPSLCFAPSNWHGQSGVVQTGMPVEDQIGDY